LPRSDQRVPSASSFVLLGPNAEALDLVNQGCSLHSPQTPGSLGLVAPVRAQGEKYLLALFRDLFALVPVPAKGSDIPPLELGKESFRRDGRAIGSERNDPSPSEHEESSQSL